jgi:hypothetical protein
MRILTTEQKQPPSHITIDGNVWPTKVLIDREQWDTLAEHGIYRYITADGPAPLGYTDWTLETDGVGPYRHRAPAGTEAEKLVALKDRKRNALYQQRVQAEKSAFQHEGRWYDGSDDSIERFGVVAQQITWALMAGTPTDTVVITGGWRDLADVGGPSTIAEIQSLLQSHYQHGVLCEQNSQAKKVEINAATTIAELDAIDLATGWPQQ